MARHGNAVKKKEWRVLDKKLFTPDLLKD